MRRIQLAPAACLAALLALAGCKDAARPTVSQVPTATPSNAVGTPIDLPTCTRCHGDPANGNAAPPASTQGLKLTTDLPVGAHQQHLEQLTLRAPIACDECHVVPLTIDEPGHMGAAWAPVVFDAPRSPGLARANGATPVWNRDDQRCSNVYCHGATVSGGAIAAPRWTQVDGSQKACGSCHGFPPTTVRGGSAPHPPSAACRSCHPDTVDASLAIDIAGGKHINGKVDLGAMGCTVCHGDPSRAEAVPLNNAAPPSGPAGETSTADLAVGAHQAHLHDGAFAKALACATCHTVPSDASHVDGVADVTFDPLASVATAGGASPSWSATSGTCSSTYCHGSTLGAGGTNTAPRWTGGAAEAQCGSCHAIPPTSGNHPPVSTDRKACGTCHPQTVDANGDILVAGGKHVDGQVEVTSYHPVGWASADQHGVAAVTGPGGLGQCQQCHGADLTGGITGVSCDACHTGGTPAWRTTCTFCHGDAARGAAVAIVNGAPPKGVRGETATTDRAVGAHQQHLLDGPVAKAIACAECHAVPSNVLDGTHANGNRDVAFGALATSAGAAPVWNGAAAGGATTCSSVYCHGATLAGGAQKAPSWTLVDGSQAQCGSCHGAPPPTASGVHAKVTALTECATCHPGTVDAAGAVKVAGGLHVNGTVDRAAYHPAGWGPSTGGTAHALAANQGVAVCIACHGDAQGTGGYVNVACVSCHKAGGTANDFGTATAPGCTACHGGTLAGNDGAGSARAPAPPRVALGHTALSPDAHARHLTPDAAFAPASTFACAQCHTAPTKALHASGAVDFTWGAVAAPPGQVGADGKPVAPTFTASGTSCASTWCHGNFRNGNARTMSWTGTSADAACGTCHALPPAGTHPSLAAGTACGGCHAGYGGTVGGSASTFTVNAATHVNGVIDVAGSHPGGWADPSQHGLQSVNVTATPGGITSCTACHVAFGSSDGTSATDCNACHAAAGHSSWRTECTFCHGGQDNATGAPARDTHVVRGTAQATTLVTVGAHTSHVAATHKVDAAFDCTACHVKPADATDAGHIDAATATITFGADAKLSGAAPAWNRTGATCASTYCHGATLNASTTRGPNATPVWTTVDGSQASCGSCHKAPPGTANHHNAAAVTACAKCHGATVDAAGAILVAGAKHINGTIDTTVSGCTTCHGNPSNPAPTGTQDANIAAAPTGSGAPDTYGSTATTGTAGTRVGAHAVHVQGARSRAVACNACHVVPTTPIHKTGVATAATITFGNLAATGGAAPVYNADQSCSASYCHGNFTGGAGGANKTPLWNVAGTLGCTSCHGAPPPSSTGHVQRTDCGSCHTGYTSTTVAAATHIDGKVDVIALACTTCHGDASRVAVANADGNVQAAPPVDTKANTATTAAGVGVHQAHVNGSRSRPVACSECHSGAVPASTTGHVKGTTTVAFGTLAKTGGASPSYAGGSCSAAYCHGNFSGGNGTAATPAWTLAGTLGCTSCHGGPPALPHPQDATCADCHPGYTASTVNAATHVDGKVDLAPSRTGCAQCHGDGTRTGIAGADANVKAAPPYGTRGEVATTARAVGAHQAHLNTATLRTNPIACSECHVVPPAGDKTHANGTAQLTWGTLAKTGGVAPAWNTTALSCASTYCHGATLQGGAKTAPVWTTVDGSQKTCTSCHGDPPPSASGHVQRTDCGSCHSGYTSASVNLATHLNGTVDVIALACTTCHGDLNRTAVANADANVKAAPPVDTLNDSATSATGVGVHQSHVNGNRSKPVACSECHSGAVPTTVTGHTKGSTTVAFGTLAKTGAVSPSYAGTGGSCAATYCHGNFTGGNGTAATPAWTAAGTLGCTACHGAPPPLPHPQNTTCSTCHSGYTSTTVNAATHVNGLVDQTGAGCTQCHGTPGRTGPAGSDPNIAAAPPIDSHGNTATTARGVGAHQTHLAATLGLSNPISCTECHAVPPANDKTHANGTAAVTFGALATTGGAAPSWNGAATGGATTCSNVYCHGNFTNGNKANAPNWTGTGQAACGTCHTIPPGGSHPTLAAGTNCGTCHTGYSATPGSTTGTVNPALHLNGKVDASGGESNGGSSCGGCHGTIFNMMNGSVTKATKHTLASDVPIDSGGTWSGNLKGTAPPYTTASCVSMCHGDHPHAITTGGTHEYNVYADANARSTTSSATTRSRTDFDAAQTNGGLCISCHLNPVDPNHPAISKAGFQAAAHNFTSFTVGTTTYTWQYTLHDNGAFQRNCTKCHASPAEGDSPTIAANGSGTVGPHASDFGSLLAGLTNPGTTPANLVCYNCHGDGTTGQNMSGKVIIMDAAKAQGHGGKVNSSTTHDTPTEEATTYNSGVYSGANRHVNCLDCHDTHMAGKVKHTVGPNDGAIGATSPLSGVSGVAYTGTLPANFAAIPSANLARVAPATAEYQICFKCHTGWAFGTTPPTGTSTLVETDLAQEFNVNNKSAHPVVNSLANQTGSTAKGLAVSQLLAPWSASAGNQTMTCTDCHNTDAASTAAQGPHGSAVTFMLAGTNKAWPYTVAGANSGTLFRVSTSETSISTANGLFCRNCHPQQNSAGSNSLHRNSNITGGQHGGGAVSECTGCHLRVPHGGKVSRLIVTTNAPARYKVGTANFAQITKGATKDSYSTSSFPAGFKSSCGQHSSGTGTEAW